MGKDKKGKKSKKSKKGKKDPGAAKTPAPLVERGYTVEKALGAGAYAAVKLAYSERLARKVAIKIILKTKAPDEYINKFLPRELEIAKLLRHPNIVIFFETIQTPDKVFVIMELADNGDVLDAVQRDGRIAEPKAGKWFYQTLDAIMYCHNKGIVHRDMKCENMLLDKKDDVKITDFGFAKLGHKPGQMSETYCGSFAYACPEILKGQPYDPRLADVWSLGVILFTMLTGRLPYDDKNLKVLMIQTQGNPFYPPEVPIAKDAEGCVNKMLLPCPQRQGLAAVREDPWFKKFDKGRQPEVEIKEAIVASSAKGGSSKKGKKKK